jgi:UDP-N-acetylmuramoyl-tripeptide--D-alanyl-D-alanine ligase
MSAALRILEWPVSADDVLPLALWDAARIAAATGGIASAEFQASGIEIDSRDVMPGDLFFALKGESLCQGGGGRSCRSPDQRSACSG